MNILLAFNDGYALPTKVMLRSLIMNEPDSLHIYVLYVDLSADSIRSIESLSDHKRVFIEFIQIDGSVLDGVPWSQRFPKEACIRLFAHLFLDKSLDRILWLDGDIIVNGPLSALYNMDFDGKTFIAEKDWGREDVLAERQKKLGMPADAVYINSGVLLIDLSEARKHVSAEKIGEYIREYRDALMLYDQDVLNGLFYDRFKVMDTDTSYNYFVKNITPENKEYVLKNARIIHFLGSCKPWDRNYEGNAFFLWWKYARLASPEYRAAYPRALFSYLPRMAKIKLADFLRNRCYPVYRLQQIIRHGR